MPIRTICECDECGVQAEGLWPFAVMNGWGTDRDDPAADRILCPDCRPHQPVPDTEEESD